MSPTTSDQQVKQYLRHLRAELRGLPRGRRQEILAQIGEHISACRSEPGVEKEDVHSLLQRLGDPAELAADARESFGVRRPRPGVFEATALLLSGLGPLVVLFAAIATPTTASSWVRVLGSVLLAVPMSLSRIWRVRDKVIGTLLLIGGSIGLPFLMHLYDQTSHVEGTSAALLTTVLVVGSVPFLATTAYLWFRMRRLASHPPTTAPA
jgi:uncharacterized membrane protein